MAECPRRHTCAVSIRDCPDDWKECGVPHVLNVVSEWLYDDKYEDVSEFNKKGE